ncbi:MAG: tRNA 5-methoxyuridine(34)/uridine 5-oxyacetic acid(34) synthase CmoB [Gammaproteobacteria bacterium]|nr:tRNA 5-methoxyuridine(34)/uridine 5-oxyacetic acid(34) synthase CmoB [Gammaproteobacteria bacterium]
MPTPPSKPPPRFAALYEALPDWAELDAALFANLNRHGDSRRWQDALDRLPQAQGVRAEYGDVVAVAGRLAPDGEAQLREALQALHPWRKGPFDLFGVRIDAEWRSDLKWRRAVRAADLAGAMVLDVGCGNGYFGWRMLQAGARRVVGIDATPLFHMQHQAINRYAGDSRNAVLPMRFEQLPQRLTEARFDAAFSMGVLYHQRSPGEHLRRLRRSLRTGGQAIVETLIVESAEPLRPVGRYARMRNVFEIPTPGSLLDALAAAGFEGGRILDIAPTTPSEQRSTPWMRFESLAEALSPDDSGRTIEGHPAPRRCVAVARNLN